jgi:hypothetical protein
MVFLQIHVLAGVGSDKRKSNGDPSSIALWKVLFL